MKPYTTYPRKYNLYKILELEKKGDLILTPISDTVYEQSDNVIQNVLEYIPFKRIVVEETNEGELIVKSTTLIVLRDFVQQKITFKEKVFSELKENEQARIRVTGFELLVIGAGQNVDIDRFLKY